LLAHVDLHHHHPSYPVEIGFIIGRPQPHVKAGTEV
jgi:hypothetical protein